MLTQKRKLKAGTSIWQAHGTPKLNRPEAVKADGLDVIVVGTGISGALVADALLNSGLRVLAVDRRKPMTGSTPASTALLQFELDTPLTILSRKIGKNNAMRTWLRSASTVQALAGRIRDLAIDCDSIELSSLYLSGDVLDAGKLAKETEARKRIGLRSELLGRKELLDLTGIRRSAAIISRGNAEADPVKLVAGLWRQFLKKGGQMMSPFEVAGLGESANRVNLTSADGRRLSALHAVFCTGYEMPAFARPKGYRIISTWALATKPQPRKLWPGRHLVWEASDPYLYMRTTLDGRVIAGGGDEDFSDESKRDALLEAKIARIAKLGPKIFPDVDFTADFSWTGNFGASETGMPAIGLARRHRRTYAVLGFGGNGITFSMLAAELVSRTINGMTDPDLDLFRL